MNNAEKQLIQAAKSAGVFLEEVILTFPRWELVDDADDLCRELHDVVDRYVEERALAGSDDDR